MPDLTAVSDLLRTVSARTDALAEARRLYADRLAPDFNPLGFLRTDEIGLSRVLAWMLDPKASHAQGAAFLKAYVELFAPTFAAFDLHSAVVQLEAPCSAGGRLDILVSGPDWRLAIENKPFAGDQPQQLTRYLATIDAVHHGRLIYLAGLEGQGPSEQSIAAPLLQERLERGDIVLSSYSALRPWLDRCRGACKAERIRSFIDDIQRHILHQFEGYSDMTEKTAVLDTILASRQSLEAAVQVAAGWNVARAELIGRLNEQLEAAATSWGWSFSDGLSASAHSNVFLTPPDMPFSVVLEFEATGYRQFCWGVSLHQADVAECERLNRIVRASEFGPGHQSDWWPWWRQASLDDRDLPLPLNWDGPDAWVMIQEDAFSDKVFAIAARLFGVLKNAV